MIKKIILAIVVLVVLFFIFRNIEITKPQDNKEENTSVFVPVPDQFERMSINASASNLVWFGQNIIQKKSHTGTLAINEEVSFLGFAPFSEAQETLRVVGGQISIDMKSLSGEEEPEMLINHLRSADFFDVENFPEATFVITGSNNNVVEGLLSIKGQSHPITVPYTLEKIDTSYKLSGKIEIDRTKWGVSTLSGTVFQDLGDSVVEDTISLEFSIVTQ